MERIKIEPRKNFTKIIEEQGLTFHKDYWFEDAIYKFRETEIDDLEVATECCYKMYMTAVQYVIDNDLWDDIKIPRSCVPAIIKSWERKDLALYGRFDFVFSKGDVKLLEFNADTPTTLLEASIIQWFLKENKFPNSDQFNSLHEQLVQRWKDIHLAYRAEVYHFAYVTDSIEDEQTVRYLMSTAIDAGLNCIDLDINDLIFDQGKYYDLDDNRITHCFKLYPFEDMMVEDPEGVCADIIWIEPLWKSVMSNKALLPILYQLFPTSEHILPAYFEKDKYLVWESYCKKPIFSREGANIQLVHSGNILEETAGEYGDCECIYQKLVQLEEYGGYYPVFGCWVVNDCAAGMGIRENSSRITNNMSRFAPHMFEVE